MNLDSTEGGDFVKYWSYNTKYLGREGGDWSPTRTIVVYMLSAAIIITLKLI